ncbi:MAG: bifunctional alpha,alpha-trehalose-phosphate synthase (UDP-forming)/trehalose-phosphatase [Gemmatimonadales bacterium]|nr:bifunctional alpha,alpha-trehalose-phosphate synthase (UDP-forming)/trehalose-phosphatase [Gemmatimonadales bacterium]
MPRVLIVSNRLPVTVHRGAAGFEVHPSPGGLATGLRGPHDRGEGWWVGWPGLSDDLSEIEREELTRALGEARLAPVLLGAPEIERYYNGFSNGFIWPVFHYLTGQLPFRSDDWPVYRDVNERFANAVAAHYRDGDLIWVHDYQLMLVPELLRRRLPKARIGFFLHVPFPALDVYRTLPHREELLQGLLGADLVGFHTTSYLRHFGSALLGLLGLPVAADHVVCGERTIRLGVHPMGVDAAHLGALADTPAVRDEAAKVREGCEKVFVSIDRLDYTKGAVRRLLAYESLLRRHPELVEKLKFVSLSAPSREQVGAYQDFRREVDAHVGRINGAFATPSWVPIHHMFQALPEAGVAALYRAADVMLVTPIRDGMNLVAKEYVAARTDELGVLVLSEYAGAAAELVEAVNVNPYDVERMALSYYQALMMPPVEQRRRMRALRTRVTGHDVHRWVEGFLGSLADEAKHGPPPATRRSPVAALPEVLAAKKLLLVLDYDGTLVSLAASPELALPDEELLALLAKLVARRYTELHILSGRTLGFLDRWFGDLGAHLHAEHGAASRPPTRKEWRKRDIPPPAWQEAVRPILSDFVRRTPGAFVEVKEAGLAWHWRRADAEVGARQANELGLHLGQLLSNLPLELLWGDRVLEVRPHGVNKGIAVADLVARRGKGTALVAIGDDRTDEDLFAALPDDAVSIVVGERPSSARYRVANVDEVRAFLRALL